MRALREAFRPEFIDRIDECIVFPSLSEESIALICKRQLDALAKRLGDKGIDFEYTDEAVKSICQSDKLSGGARHIRRRIAKLCERPISEKILAGEIKKGSKIFIQGTENCDEPVIVVR